MTALTEKQYRQELGDFSSIVCVKAIVTGIEEALGEKAAAIALIAAGRKRGKELAASLGLTGKGTSMTMDNLQKKVNESIGKEGTRLCVVDKIGVAGEAYIVHTRETVCSVGEQQGSPRNCTYTLGAIQGFLEACMGKRLRGKQTESVLRGGTHDVLEYTIIE